MEAGLLVLRTTAALAAALAIASWYRHGSAALRHFVLAAGVGVAALALPLGGVMPAWELAAPVESEPPAAALPAVTVPTDAVAAAPAVASAAKPRWTPGAADVALALWSMCAVALVAPILLGLLGLRRITAAAAPVDDERWLRLRDEIAGQLGVTRRVRLLWADMSVGTWGLVQPRIVLPAEAVGWDDDRARAVLAHELAHVRRGDWAVQLAADVVRALFWFNPLAWIVSRRLRDESERACDDVVLHTGITDAAYASHLLDIARATRGADRAAAVAMARPSTLEGRITAMLNPALDRRSPSRRVRVVTVALLLLVAAAAAVRVAAQVAGPAALEGYVYDSSGAVLPGVEMGLVNEQGIKWSTPTDGTGRFEFAPVGAGKYVLEAVVPGFKTFKQDIVLEREKDWNKVITLEVGTLEETIRVTARRPRTPTAAPAPVTSTGRVRVGGNIKAPAKVFNMAPIYPPSMQAAGLEGVVKLDVLIGADGSVVSVKLANAQVHPEFAASAATAVKQWKFTPTLLNFRPVEVEMTASISFGLSDEEK
jgi:TonB family protein